MDNIVCKTLTCSPSDCPGQGKWDVLFLETMGSWHFPALCHPQSNRALVNQWLHSLSLSVRKCRMTPMEAISDVLSRIYEIHTDLRWLSWLPLMSKIKHCPFFWHRIFLLHLLEMKLESFTATKAAAGGTKNSLLQLLPFENYQWWPNSRTWGPWGRTECMQRLGRRKEFPRSVEVNRNGVSYHDKWRDREG